MSRRKGTVLTVLIILALLFIWGNSALSRAASDTLSDAVENTMSAVGELPGGGGIKTTLIIRKSAHFIEYLVLGALVMLRLGRNKKGALWAFLACCAAACLDETVQILSGRASMIKDCVLDAAGAAVGIGIIILITAIRNKNRVMK
ncbi:MAG: VanZ family protein [Oscillospiraceae bacterium]|nr:VanZ family protein [Oscillospiraceae bacterium]